MRVGERKLQSEVTGIVGNNLDEKQTSNDSDVMDHMFSSDGVCFGHGTVFGCGEPLSSSPPLSSEEPEYTKRPQGSKFHFLMMNILVVLALQSPAESHRHSITSGVTSRRR